MAIYELKMFLDGYDDDIVKDETVGMFATRELAEARIVELALEGRTIRSAEIVEAAVIVVPTVDGDTAIVGAGAMRERPSAEAR